MQLPELIINRILCGVLFIDFCTLTIPFFVLNSILRGTDQKHPPLSLKEILPMSDASLDLIPSLNVGVVDVSPSLQQQVRREEHERPQLLILLHPPKYI